LLDRSSVLLSGDPRGPASAVIYTLLREPPLGLTSVGVFGMILVYDNLTKG
jgi:hypothetical protein